MRALFALAATLAGAAGLVGKSDGTGTAAKFFYPAGIAVTGAGTIYVADTFNHLIRRVAQNGTVSTMAGIAGSRGTTDGGLGTSRFAYPAGIAVEIGRAHV